MREIGVGTSPVLSPTFQVGDRVQRCTDVYDDASAYRHGTVVLRYSIYDSGHEYSLGYPELYAVLWDGRGFEKGFLPHGLDKEDVTSDRAYSDYVRLKIAGELD